MSSSSRIDLSVKPAGILIGAAILGFATFLYWFICLKPMAVDSALPHYQKPENLSGHITSVGSDTLENIIVLCARKFKEIYPGVSIDIEAKGSLTGPPALTEGRSQIAPMSRLMNDQEIGAFVGKYGYKPTAYKVAIDALAVYVNKSNPIRGMTLQQVDGVFSSSPKRGGMSVSSWGELGLTGKWAALPIAMFGRNKVSGTHDYFREVALQNGEYKATIREGISQDVVTGVSEELGGIGYSGIGWKTSDVRALPLGDTADHLIAPTYANALNGSYPLTRFLYVYVNQKQGEPLDKVTQEFLKYVLSREGQEDVVEAYFYPLSAKIVSETLRGKN